MDQPTIRTRLVAVAIDQARSTSDASIALPGAGRRMIFHEIIRIYAAMESLKNELTLRGVSFAVDPHDHEHPNAAYRRITRATFVPPAAVVLYLVVSILIIFAWFMTSNARPGSPHAPQAGHAQPLR